MLQSMISRVLGLETAEYSRLLTCPTHPRLPPPFHIVTPLHPSLPQRASRAPTAPHLSSLVTHTRHTSQRIFLREDIDHAFAHRPQHIRGFRPDLRRRRYTSTFYPPSQLCTTTSNKSGRGLVREPMGDSRISCRSCTSESGFA